MSQFDKCTRHLFPYIGPLRIAIHLRKHLLESFLLLVPLLLLTVPNFAKFSRNGLIIRDKLTSLH